MSYLIIDALTNCECGATAQTADLILSQCPTHRVLQGMFCLMELDNEAKCWLNTFAVRIRPWQFGDLGW